MKVLVWLSLLSCNQIVYDEIYKAIIQQTLKSSLTKQDIDTKSDAIERLRQLCKGQLSTYERGI